MGALFFYLLRNRKSLLKLTDEIRNSFSNENEITKGKLNNCLYLDACVKETMRLVPAVPNLSPRLVKASGLVIGGKYVPPGTQVGTSLYTLMRSSRHFGCPNNFIPERWLSACQSKLLNLEAFEPFGIGPRSCIGRNLAELEVKMTLARTLYNYDLQILPGKVVDERLPDFRFQAWAVASGSKNQLGSVYLVKKPNVAARAQTGSNF